MIILAVFLIPLLPIAFVAALFAFAAWDVAYFYPWEWELATRQFVAFIYGSLVIVFGSIAIDSH